MLHGELKEELESKRYKWAKQNVQRLLTPYPRHVKVDRVLEKLEDDFFHDDIHNLADVAGEEPAVAEEDGGVPSEFRRRSI